MIRFIILILLITGIAYAEEISAPPPLKNEPVAEQLYLWELYNNWNNLEITTLNPNNNRLGDTGDIIIYKTSLLEYYLSVNIDGAYHWWAIQLTDVL